LRNILARFSSGVISNSESGELYWKKRLPGKNSIKISNIVPIEELEHVDCTMERPGFAITVGRLDENKNVLTLLKSVNKLKLEGVIVPLWIVGDGPLFTYFQSFISENGLTDHVKLYGYRGDVWSMIKMCKVFVSLSYYEGESNTVLEATVLGNQLILSDIPAHHSLNSSDRTVYVRPDSEDQVAAALKFALNNPFDQHKTANSANQKLLHRSASEISLEHIKYFNQIINQCHTNL